MRGGGGVGDISDLQNLCIALDYILIKMSKVCWVCRLTVKAHGSMEGSYIWEIDAYFKASICTPTIGA